MAPPVKWSKDEKKVLDKLKEACASRNFNKLPLHTQQNCVLAKQQQDKNDEALAAQVELAARTELNNQRLQAVAYVTRRMNELQTQGILLLGALQRASNEYDNILAARAAQSPYGEIALGIGLALLPELAVCGRAFKALMGRRQTPSLKSLAKELIESDDMVNTLATYFENVNQKAVNSAAKARLGRFADSLDKVSKDTIEAVRNPLVANANIDSETTKRFEAWSAKNQIMTSIVTGLQRSLIAATFMELVLHSFIFWYEGVDLLKLVHEGFKLTGFGNDLPYSATVYDVFSDLILYDMLRAYVKSYFTVVGDIPIDQMPSRWPESNIKGLDEAQRTLIYNRFRKVPWKDGSRPPVNSYKDLIKHWKGGQLEPPSEIRDYPIQ
jgi:hypothetical protein